MLNAGLQVSNAAALVYAVDVVWSARQLVNFACDTNTVAVAAVTVSYAIFTVIQLLKKSPPLPTNFNKSSTK